VNLAGAQCARYTQELVPAPPTTKVIYRQIKLLSHVKGKFCIKQIKTVSQSYTSTAAIKKIDIALMFINKKVVKSQGLKNNPSMYIYYSNISNY